MAISEEGYQLSSDISGVDMVAVVSNQLLAAVGNDKRAKAEDIYLFIYLFHFKRHICNMCNFARYAIFGAAGVFLPVN